MTQKIFFRNFCIKKKLAVIKTSRFVLHKPNSKSWNGDVCDFIHAKPTFQYILLGRSICSLILQR